MYMKTYAKVESIMTSLVGIAEMASCLPLSCYLIHYTEL